MIYDRLSAGCAHRFIYVNLDAARLQSTKHGKLHWINEQEALRNRKCENSNAWNAANAILLLTRAPLALSGIGIHPLSHIFRVRELVTTTIGIR